MNNLDLYLNAIPSIKEKSSRILWKSRKVPIK